MAFTTSCGPSSLPPAIERVALLTVENLTGDASLSWMQDAVPSVAAAQLAGVGRILPFHGDTSRDAAAVAANTLIHGYFDRRRGAVHFEFSIEDATTHKMRSVTVDGDVVRAADALAKAVDPAAKPFSTKNAAAVQAWTQHDFERATQLDPDFGAAWRDLIQSQLAQPSQAIELATKALARSSLRSPLERGQIALLSGQLRQDGKAIGEASAELGRLLPNDSGMARKLAEQESNARRFDQAVQFYRTVLRLEPEDSSIYNSLGYAQCFAGDLAGARKSFEEYSRHPGQEANGFDSVGEVLFMAGQFGEAEKFFLQAHQANPALLNGADLQKAAYARWLSGDLREADAIFEKYLKYRSEHADQTVVWRRAVWEYSTGRQPAAIDRLKAITGPASQLAQSQLAVFQNLVGLPKDLVQLEQTLKRTAPAGDGLVRTLYAAELLKAGKRAEAEQLAKLWPLPESAEPLLQAVVYPLYLELKQNLAK